MGIEKDTTFKFIGKNFLDVIFDLAKLPESVNVHEIREVTEELISLRIAQFRPDFIGCDGKTIVMFEYESKHVGTPSKKRFHTYVVLYDYEKNDEDMDIIFCVITTKEKTKVVEYKIGDIDSFKIFIFNIRDLGMEKIISNANFKIKHNMVFTARELVELALTSIMDGTREENIKQFYKLSKMMDEIIFEDEDAKTSFCGIILKLSDMYFEESDPIRKKIQGVFMGKVDCIVEMRKEEFDNGYDEGHDNGYDEAILKMAENMLSENLSIETVSRFTELPVNELNNLKMKLNL
ncbi:MAG: hypothetical protein IJG09_00645 [Methanobrevibacter sp.]|nr:hypothetical protein [Methanobrevibacter sp.]